MLETLRNIHPLLPDAVWVVTLLTAAIAAYWFAKYFLVEA